MPVQTCARCDLIEFRTCPCRSDSYAPLLASTTARTHAHSPSHSTCNGTCSTLLNIPECTHAYTNSHVRTHACACSGYWLIKGTDIQAAGKTLGLCPRDTCQLVVDTGTSILVGDPPHSTPAMPTHACQTHSLSPCTQITAFNSHMPSDYPPGDNLAAGKPRLPFLPAHINCVGIGHRVS